MATKIRDAGIRVFLLLACVAIGCSGNALNSFGSSLANDGRRSKIRLQGAGASFPAPLYVKWFKAFSARHPGTQIDYQSVGSGSGVKALIDGTVDFGASDAAMTEKETAQVKSGVIQIPLTAGSIALVYNLPDVSELKLTREAYVGIFSGRITKWSDVAIVSSNPGAKLPDVAINVVLRADSSGTSFVFTKHLSAIDEAFAEDPGTSKMPNWTFGTKAKGNEGVSAGVATTPASIGYVEYGFAKGINLKMAQLENHAGSMIAPTMRSARASLETTELPDNLVAWIPDPTGENCYPIVTYTWLLVKRTYADKEKGTRLNELIEFCLTEGQKGSEALGYIPLPEKSVVQIKSSLAKMQTLQE